MNDLETPVPVVDVERLERNLRKVADYAASHRLALRPHIKTHKSPLLASKQLELGAVGVTCATPREAEVMAAVCDDLLIAYPTVHPGRTRRIASLAGARRVIVMVDSERAVETIARAAEDAGHSVGVLVEIDVGMKRVGVATTDEAVALARAVSRHRSLEYVGIGYYPGHIREHVNEQQPALQALAGRVQQFVEALSAAGYRPAVVSGGSTPALYSSHLVTGTTEIRPGTYIYNDRTTAEVGACAPEDCALTILATVVSTAVPGQAVIDAGTKALGREPMRGADASGYGALLDHPDVSVKAMSEEHGMLDVSRTGWKPAVGDRVRVVPNHVCVSVHLHEAVYAIRGDRVLDRWPVTARGREPVAFAD